MTNDHVAASVESAGEPQDESGNGFDDATYAEAMHEDAVRTGLRVAETMSFVRRNGAGGLIKSDDVLALLFAREHGARWRYVAGWGTWFYWRRHVWEKDETLAAQEAIRLVCRTAAGDILNRDSEQKRLGSSRTVADVGKLVRSDPRVTATVDQWDADPWLLNTPGGTVDLKTGAMQPHNPNDYMTKTTAVAPGGDCPLWLQFVGRVTDRDLELQAFLQRMLGYCLTGVTVEQALFFLYGTGANGKSVLIDTVAGILGDYQRTAPIETFTASSSDRHPTELAMLRGARAVTAVETEAGRRWAESKIKTLTGGDKITARFMRQNFFEYTPQFKLLIAGNHKPGLWSVDEAIRRRFHMVPFAVTIPAAERDPNLRDRLKAEWPGILQWMIEGCLNWQREGLSPPAAVTEATAAYLQGEDAMAGWIEECCDVDANAWTARTVLFTSWKAWTDLSNVPAGNAARFNDNLETRGFRPATRRGKRGFSGIKVNTVTASDAAARLAEDEGDVPF